MSKLRVALHKLAEKLQTNEALLHKAQRRHKKFRERAEANHIAQVGAQEDAQKYFAYGPRENVAKGNALLDKANRCASRALRSHHKAIYWKGKIRQQTARINHLERSVKETEAELAKWKKEHGVYFEGKNKVRGGTPEQRLRAAIHKAALNYRKGLQPGYYSQEGAPRAYDHGLYRYPFGHIWDCSTFADAMYFVCGLDSPSGPSGFTAGGFTGTELANGRPVNESQARSGDLVIFLRFPGDTAGHHVEVVDDPQAKTTIGHGDSAIDSAGGGSIGYNLFGDGLYEIRTYH